jgi:hypothetical protein
MGSSYMDELLQEIDYDMLPGTVLLVVLGYAVVGCAAELRCYNHVFRSPRPIL